jgi:hypothetical protein
MIRTRHGTPAAVWSGAAGRPPARKICQPGMDTEEIALDSFELNVALRQHGQGSTLEQFSDPPAADARGPAEKHNVRTEV